MKAKTTGALTIAALAAIAALVFVFWRAAAVETVYPVEKARQTFVRKVAARVAGMWSGGAAAAENVRLRRERDELAMRCGDLVELEEENARLRRALEFKARQKGRWVVAGVLSAGGGAAGARKTIRVDKGSFSGVGEGMVVRVPEGLVGRVASVTAHTADVLLVTDPALKVACTLEHHPKSFGILWGGTENGLLLRHLKVTGQVAPQTRVLTSGLGGVFPAGIPVGTLLVDDKAAENPAGEGEVQPTVDFATLEDVFIRCEK